MKPTKLPSRSNLLGYSLDLRGRMPLPLFSLHRGGGGLIRTSTDAMDAYVAGRDNLNKKICRLYHALVKSERERKASYIKDYKAQIINRGGASYEVPSAKGVSPERNGLETLKIGIRHVRGTFNTPK
jgi:hypothetical protein